jgi:hypothetical protein
VTDGDRTRDLRSHNSRETVPVCSIVSVQSADLQVFREIKASDCPLRTSLYWPGCSTVAVLPDSSAMAPLLIPCVEFLLPSPAVDERVNRWE